jgi:hypothetical protein
MSSESSEKSISDEEVPECISEKIDEGWDQDRAVAACLNMAEEGSYDGDAIVSSITGLSVKEVNKAVEDIDTQPTQEMADVASEVLEKIDDSEFDNDDCGTRTGLERANQLENREDLSADTIGRMVSFFARHDGNQEVDNDVDSKWEDCGFVAWQLWGGDPGRDWAERKLEEIEEEREEDSVNETNTMSLNKDVEHEDKKFIDVEPNTKNTEIVKEEQENGEIFVNVPIQALSEDRDGDYINEKGQEKIIEQLKTGQVPMFFNHGVGSSAAHYDARDIVGQFVDGETRDSTTIAKARLRMVEGENGEEKLHSDAKEIVNLLKQDMPLGFSVGFIAQETEERKDGEGMEISDLDLMEVSAVGIPSNPDAVPQAMGEAVQMAKNAGLSKSKIKSTIEKAFQDTMSEKQESTEDSTDENSKSEVKQMTSEDVEMLMDAVSSRVGEHISMAMDEAEDELMEMIDEEDTEEEPDEEEGDNPDEEDEYDDDEEEMNQDGASDHTEESEGEKDSAESEDKDTDVESTAEKNKQGSGTITTQDEKDEGSEDSEDKSQELDPRMIV